MAALYGHKATLTNRVKSSFLALALLCACEAPSHPGPIVRLVRAGTDTIVVNRHHPAALGVLALDAKGDTVAGVPLEYLWAGGDSIAIDPSGAVMCPQSGDAALIVKGGAVRTHLEECC